MKAICNNRFLYVPVGIFILFMVIGCKVDKFSKNDPAEPEFDASVFSDPANIDNSYLPLFPGVVHVYQVETDEDVETVVTEVLDETRIVNGIESLIVRDRVFLEDLLAEDTHDWFAQDDAGNVWYMGEDVINYEYDDDGNIIGTDNEGAWEAGEDILGMGSLAEPGIVMKAILTVGDSYRQEFYEDVAEDMGIIVDLADDVELSDGSEYTCLKTRDWSALEPGTSEYKYYAPDVGLVMEESQNHQEILELKGIFHTGADEVFPFNAANFTNPTTIDNAYLPLTPGDIKSYEMETEDGLETIETEVLATLRTVNGIICVVFRDRVYLDGVLMEDTHDWFAQDDAGNVWYMGEDVVNYEYDDDGTLLGTNDDGAWEAGVDGALPGVVMWANPLVGDSYYQEYYADEAEDMGMIVAEGVEVVLEDGTVYENCLQILDWTLLDPSALEYKYYAPGIGLVREEVVGGDEFADLVDMN